MGRHFRLAMVAVSVFVYATAISAYPISTKPTPCFRVMLGKIKQEDELG